MEADGVWLERVIASFFLSLAVLYHRWGKLELAEKHYELSLHLDPEAPGTRDNYNMLRRKMDQLKQLPPWGRPTRAPTLWSLFLFFLIHLVLVYHSRFVFASFGNKEHVLCVTLVLQYVWAKWT